MNTSYLLRMANRFIYLTSSEYLYHVSYYRSIPLIAVRGLRPGNGTGAGRGGNKGYSNGKLFSTSASGVAFWYDRMQLHAEDRSDNIYKDELVPVVIRWMPESKYDVDEIGSEDANAEAFHTNEVISPDKLEIWNGNSWVSIGNYKSINILDALDIENDNGITLYYFKQNNNPLIG